MIAYWIKARHWKQSKDKSYPILDTFTEISAMCGESPHPMKISW